MHRLEVWPVVDVLGDVRLGGRADTTGVVRGQCRRGHQRRGALLRHTPTHCVETVFAASRPVSSLAGRRVVTSAYNLFYQHKFLACSVRKRVRTGGDRAVCVALMV
jgi:hypothetical protein